MSVFNHFKQLHIKLAQVFDEDSIFIEFRLGTASREYFWVVSGQTPSGTTVTEHDPDVVVCVNKAMKLGKAER